MKLAIISDVHSNLVALETALADIDRRGVDAIVCLGDVVGYGADPAACLDLVRERCAAVVRGNHDDAVALERGVEVLPKDGQAAAAHNRAALADEQLAWLAGLPLVDTFEGVTLAHATPQAPERWMRLESFMQGREQFAYFDTDVCFVGHTHIPAVMADKLGVLSVRRGPRYIVNVGAVGQPRDNNPRLSYGVFDADAFTYENVRLPYDVDRAAARIREEGLPRRLGKRLHSGT